MDNRIFETTDAQGNKITLRFNRPTHRILNDADFAYKQHFSRCMRNGIMSQAEAIKIIKENGSWQDSDELKMRELRDKIYAIEERFKEDLSNEEGNRLYLEVKKYRTELSELNGRINSITENTAESMAGDYRIQYLTAQCVVYNDSGKKVFKDLDDLINRSNERLAMDSTSETLIANYEYTLGMKLDIGSLLIENAWLKKSIDKTKSEEVKLEEPVVIDGKPSKKKK